MLGTVGVATHARLAELDLENTEVAQLDSLTVREAFGQMIERPLNNVEHILLHHAGLVADADNQIALR